MNAAAVRQLAAKLGVPEQQVSRDVAISHALLALEDPKGIVFFGGTALCRTHLPGFRLSEDIDLLVDDVATARDLIDDLPARIRRHYPSATVSWERDGLTQVARLDTGVTGVVKVQLVPNDASYRRFPTEQRPVELRYDGLPEKTTLTVPTPRGFAAMKLKAWSERGHPRDLADLHALHERGWLDEEAVRIAGEATSGVQSHAFADDRIPDGDTWTADLAAQMRQPPDRKTAFATVRAAVARLEDWPDAEKWSAEVAAQADADDWTAMEQSSAALVTNVARSQPLASDGARCGFRTASGRSCRNPVARPGERCHLHR